VDGTVLPRDAKPLGLDNLCGVGCTVSCKTECYIEKPTFTEGVLIRCQSYHDDYACTFGRVAMPGGDGMDSYTRVPVARHMWGMWPCPVMPDNKCHRFPKPCHLVKIYPILETPGWSDWMSGPVPGQGGRRAGQTGGEILPANIYYNEENVIVCITLGLSYFYVGGSSSSVKSGGAISGMRCMVHQSFTARGNQS
jgi:hypothetical protein